VKIDYVEGTTNKVQWTPFNRILDESYYIKTKTKTKMLIDST